MYNVARFWRSRSSTRKDSRRQACDTVSIGGSTFSEFAKFICIIYIAWDLNYVTSSFVASVQPECVLYAGKWSHFRHFLEHEGSLPFSPRVATGTYSEPRWSRPRLNILFKSLLSSHLRPRLPSGFFPSSWATKTLYAFLFAVRATWHAYLMVLDLITVRVCWDVRLWSLHAAVGCTVILLSPA